MVRARQAVGVARGGARRFPDAAERRDGAARQARRRRRCRRSGGAPTGVRAARTRIRAIGSRRRTGPSARGRRRIRRRSAIATSRATPRRSRAASGATSRSVPRAAIGRGRRSRKASGLRNHRATVRGRNRMWRRASAPRAVERKPWQDKPRGDRPWSNKPAGPNDRPWQTKPTGPRAQRKPWVPKRDARAGLQPCEASRRSSLERKAARSIGPAARAQALERQAGGRRA